MGLEKLTDDLWLPSRSSSVIFESGLGIGPVDAGGLARSKLTPRPPVRGGGEEILG